MFPVFLSRVLCDFAHPLLVRVAVSSFTKITVVSPTTFFKRGAEGEGLRTKFATEAQRSELSEAWREALTSSGDLPSSTFDITYTDIKLFKAAAVLKVADPSGHIKRMRDAVRKLETDRSERLAAAGAFDPDAGFAMRTCVCGVCVGRGGGGVRRLVVHYCSPHVCVCVCLLVTVFHTHSLQ